MSRGFDHIVHAVRDRDAAATLYRRMGFTVSAPNRHPPEWGTENHIVQFAGVYLEVLGLGDMTKTVPHGERHFSFGAFNRGFIERGEGLSMLALEGGGASDAELFRTMGIGDFSPFEMARDAKRPDGSTVRLAFSLAFARDLRAPDFGAFTIRHHFPENFWNPAFQVHGNTATNVAGIVVVAENPNDHRDFLSVFAGQRDLLAAPAGLTIKTPRGDIQVLTPDAFRDHFGTEPPDTTRGARLAAMRIVVHSRDELEKTLEAGRIAWQGCRERIVIGPETALGATLAFEGS